MQTATRVLVRCGCLNIAKRSVTPKLADTYAQMSHETLTRLGMRTAVASTRPRCASASPTSTRTSGAWTWTAASSTCPR